MTNSSSVTVEDKVMHFFRKSIFLFESRPADVAKIQSFCTWELKLRISSIANHPPIECPARKNFGGLIFIIFLIRSSASLKWLISGIIIFACFSNIAIWFYQTKLSESKPGISIKVGLFIRIRSFIMHYK